MKTLKYALLDWDNTLRKGFTIQAWMEYLHVRQIISDEYYVDFLHQFELYDKKTLEYNQLSDNTTSIYVKAIEGKDVLDIESAGRDFCVQDNGIFPYVGRLFHDFRINRIEVIVISGTPQMLLEHYSKLLGIDEVYGLVVGVKEGCYTDIIERDYGACKSEIVDKICVAKGEKPIFAMGDSMADEPLINAAKFGCYIDKNTGTISLDGRTIGSISSACETIERLGIFS